MANKYRIDSVLRETEAGKIYLATHLSMDKPVSVKILAPVLAADENAVKEFSNEARAASRIAHPNVLSVTDFGSDVNGTVYAVLEDASGETLAEAIAEKGKFALNRAVRISWQIASALSVAHAAGIVHAQLKPENILLSPTGGNSETVKVLGFGAAVKNEKDFPIGVEPSAKDLQYLAPEQNASEKATERSDVYALGVILYEMLAGEAPFSADTANALVMKQTQNPPTPLSTFRSDLPELLELVVLKALAVNPEMRYESATEFANALNAATNNVGGAQTILIEDEAPKNNMWKTAFVVLAGITLLAAGLIYATSVKQTNVQTALKTDENGSPVQPINPATGMNEQGLSAQMMPYSPQTGASMTLPDGSSVPLQQPAAPSGDGLGDGYNAWANGGKPPAGAPPPMMYAPQGGPMVTIPGGASPFMPAMDGSGNYVMVPVNPNANVQPSPTPKNGKTPPNANTAAPQTSPTPVTGTPQTPPTEAAKPAPTPAQKTDKTPAVKPTPTPKTAAPKTTAPPASTGKPADNF